MGIQLSWYTFACMHAHCKRIAAGSAPTGASLCNKAIVAITSLHHSLSLPLSITAPTAVMHHTLFTSFIPYRDRRSNPPSLADLALQVLGQSLRSESAAHDCQQDAAAAMQLVNHALQHGIPQDMQAPPKKVESQ